MAYNNSNSNTNSANQPNLPQTSTGGYQAGSDYAKGNSNGTNHNRFNRSPRAKKLIEAVKSYPSSWQLLPVEEKLPRLKNWQHSSYSHAEICHFLNNGYQLTSKKSGKDYTAYPSGVSILTGDASDGILLVDFDGPSAGKLWEVMGGNPEIASQTRTHSSGKKGRKQCWFKIPDTHRDKLENFTRHVVTSWGIDTKADSGEMLEFRYNRCQSVLPPSLHPTTGAYKWANEGAIAHCPEWLLKLLVNWADGQKAESEAKAKARAESERIRTERLEAWRAKQNETTKGESDASEDVSLADFLEFEVLPRLSPEQIFNHPGHNWHYVANRMEGAPVWRESSSGRSVHVNLSDCSWWDFGWEIGGGPVQYRWILSGGTPGSTPRGKDFTEVVKSLASEAGLELPKRKTLRAHKPDKLRITHFDQAKKVATNAVNSFALRLKDALTPKVKPASEGCVNYEPGKLKEVVTQQKKIEYKSSDRLNIWAEAARGGVKNIIDSSGVGSGKSHAAGNIKPSNFGAERAIYLHSRHANPATLTLGAWDDLPPRHNGLVANPNRKNPDASPHISWPRDGQVPNVPGNCKYAAKFNEAIAANVDYEELKGICAACEFGKKLDKDGKVESNLCQDGEGEGYGYKFQRAIALNSPKLRAHPNSLPPFDAEKPEFYNEALIFVDEAEAEMMATIIKEVKVTSQTITSTFGNLEPKNPGLFDVLTPVRRALYAAVEKENLGKYGKSDRELRDELAHHITANSNNPSIFLEHSEEAIAIEQSIAKALTNDVESQIKKHGIEGLQFATNWLPDFIKILKDEAAGSFSINQSGLLTLRVRSQKINEILANTKVNILSDATAKAETLIEMVGLDKPQTIEIAESTLKHDNLTITQVNFNRHIEKGERSKELQNRIDAAHNELVNKFGKDLISFNYKANAKDGDLTTFADNRGVNHAEKKLALCTVGDPYLHLGAIAADYQAIYRRSPKIGEDEAFDAYYLQRCQGEIIQMVGRLRSGRRSEALSYYHFGNLSLDFLSEALPGATVAVVAAGELSPDAAPKDARHISALVAQAIELVQRGHKLTQAKLAQSLETCQSQISRWLDAIPGGWKFVKSMVLKICKSLYRDSYRELHNFDNGLKPLSPEELEFLREFAEPSLLAAFADDGHSAPDDEMMATTIQVSFEQFGDRAADILAHLSVESGTKLLIWILQKAGLVENSIFQHLRDLAFS